MVLHAATLGTSLDLCCGSLPFNTYLYVQTLNMCFLMLKTVLLEVKCYRRVSSSQKQTKEFTAFLLFLSHFSAIPYCCAETALPCLTLLDIVLV